MQVSFQHAYDCDNREHDRQLRLAVYNSYTEALIMLLTKEALRSHVRKLRVENFGRSQPVLQEIVEEQPHICVARPASMHMNFIARPIAWTCSVQKGKAKRQPFLASLEYMKAESGR